MFDEFTVGNEFVKQFVKDKKYIYLTSITHEFCDFALNWFQSLSNIGVSDLALVVCADKQSYESMQKHNISSVYLEANIDANVTGEQWIENEKHFKMCGLYIIFKNYDVDIIMSDVDIVFLKNPIDKLLFELEDNDWLAMSDRMFVPFVAKRKQGRDLYISDDKTEIHDTGITPQTLYGEENAGFCYIPNPTAQCRLNENSLKDKQYKIQFLENFQKNSTFYDTVPKGTEEGCLQSAVNKKVKETTLRVKKLNCFDFPNGSAWNVSYIREKIKNSCYIVHYNFCEFLEPLKVREEKMNRMKKHGHWYLS
jgi:hypothetical protein